MSISHAHNRRNELFASPLRFDGPHDQFFQPKSFGLHNLSQRIKQSFAPARILNPGRLYTDL